MIPRRSFIAGVTGSVAALANCREPGRDSPPGTVTPGRPTGSDDRSWAAIRDQFAIGSGVTYLNNASLGLPPAAVADAVARGYRLHSEDPLQAKHELSAVVAERSVPGLARLLGASPDEIVLTRNATEALHLQALGLDLRAGDEVVTTTQEHPAGIKPWRYRAVRHGVLIREVLIPSPFATPDDVVDRIAAAIGPRTRAIAFCHVTRGGHLYPVRELTALARERGLVSLVDGAQAVGMFPVDLHDLGCDAYAASLHKWLLGPIGTGLWYLRNDARPRWRSAFEPEITPEAPGLGPGGTADLPVRAAIDVAVRFAESLGLDAVAARCHFLSDYLKSRLAAVPGVRLVSGPTAATCAPGSTIFVLGAVDPFPTVAGLDARHLYIDEHVRDGHPAFRISTHYYNTTADIDRAVDALAVLA